MIVYFNRGFRIDCNPDRFGDGITENAVIEAGDALANDFRRAVVTGKMNRVTWEHAKPVLDYAISLFDNLKDWFLDQITHNSKVNGHRLEFLIDTIGYIINGKRAIGNESWLQLIVMQDPQASDKEPLIAKSQSVIAMMSRYSGTELLQRWISHPNGLIDLIDSLYIMFGARIQRNLQEPVT